MPVLQTDSGPPYFEDAASSVEDRLRIPPHSVQAEQSVLGGLMLDNSTFDQIADRITERDFYLREHLLIFRAVDQLAEQGKPFDVVTLNGELERVGVAQSCGGLAYLGTLANDTPSAANIRAYADIVREHSVKRQLIRVGTAIADSGFNPEGRNGTELLDEAERKVFEIAEQRSKGERGFQPLSKLLGAAVDRIETLFEQDDPITGVSTGFVDFDHKTSGMQPGDLIIIAGRPSMGKTAFAMNIAENVAIKVQRPVAVFSMEMPGEALAMRMMSSLGRIDQHKVRTGRLEDDEWPRLTSAINLLSNASMFIDDTPALTPTELRARARRLKREQKDLGLIVIDYLQLMQAPGAAETRANEVSAISRSLKALAKELSVPVVALSQLNRGLEQRTNKRPIMSDLRESGSIEQDADLVVFLYRDEYYNPESTDKGVAEVIISKQRNGPTGAVRMSFQGQYTLFADLTENAGYGVPY
ncbi:MAG: replicative DNA helicase [Gammaproteobacteria bacterium]|nr:replicative DNA helicase [Gammaproteobacteria bacterium]MBU1653344.1 replicative DNA helicase [Gammaproteobacteria bacterium]MBU1962772.1 replicative DNA helicase [Gammaproteobacteria bacterium]